MENFITYFIVQYINSINALHWQLHCKLPAVLLPAYPRN